jgi:RNA polymerase sigma factor (sigma-70 family)
VNNFRRKRQFHDVAEARRKTSHDEIHGDQELALIERFKQGDRTAGALLIEAHEPFIRRMANRSRLRGLEDEDLLQEAKCGFLEGVKRYDATRGTKLITCAVYWIRATVNKACEDTGKLVRIPNKTLGKVVRARDEQRKAEMVGNDVSTETDEVLEEEIVKAAAVAMAHPVSFDAPWSSESDEGLVETFASSAPTPEDLYVAAEGDHFTRAHTSGILTLLNPRARDIIEARVLADEPETLDGIGERYNVTRERIRQLEVKALGKLRKVVERRNRIKRSA